MNFTRRFNINPDKHFFLGAKHLACLLVISTPVWSQDRQMMVIDDGDGPIVMQLSMPNFDVLKEPDFVRPDLITINSILDL